MKKLIIFLMMIIVSMLLIACDKEEETKISSVTFTNDGQYTFTSDAFRLHDIKLIVKYNNGKEEEISLNESMISTNDLENLLLSGEHLITVNYDATEYFAVIKISETEYSRSVLPVVMMYSIEEEMDGKIVKTYYTTGKGGYTSFILSLNLNDVTNLLFTKDEDLSGEIIYNINDDKLLITYSKGERIMGVCKLFTISYDDKESSNIDYDYEYANIFYDYNEQTEEVFTIKNYGFVNR